MQEDDQDYIDSSILVLDVDADTVGQCISVLKPMFQNLTSSEEGPESEEDSVIVVAVYACDFTAKDRWPHIWEYLKRNGTEFLKAGVKLTLIFMGSGELFEHTIGKDICYHSTEIPDRMIIATPSYVLAQTTYSGLLLTNTVLKKVTVL